MRSPFRGSLYFGVFSFLFYFIYILDTNPFLFIRFLLLDMIL